ncbi:MAG TPA: serine/threonine-protein kinase [Bryobacteraceae bacterium]|nr:serine/threonine-protein kinase [Bryobacteraceae bacterium]
MFRSKQFGRYEIICKLGRGMTDVYLANDPTDNRRAVLKIIEQSPDPWTQTVLEAEKRGSLIQKQLHEADPRFLELYDSGERSGFYFVAMEYVEGKSVAEVLQAEGRMEPVRAARYALEVASQLERLHSFEIEIDGRNRAVVHGDIKPSNLQICPDGSIRLLDFGISKAITFTRNLTNHNLGSPGYCSPERLSRAQVDPQSDLWALGATLYEMVGGLPPYQAQTTQKLEELIRSKRPPRALPDDCPAGLKAVIRKSLAGDIENRYRSASAFTDDLRLFLDGRPTQAETDKEHAWQANPTVEKPQTAARPVTEAANDLLGRLGQVWKAVGSALQEMRSAPGVPLKIPRRIRVFFRGLALPMILAILVGALLGALIYIESAFAYRFWVESRPIRGPLDYTQKTAKEISADWNLYQTLERRNFPLGRFSPVTWLKLPLRSAYLAAADDVIDRYRNSSDPLLRDFDWPKARMCLEHAGELERPDAPVKGKLALINGFLKLEQNPHTDQSAESAKSSFEQAASLLPRSPDPHLGLARVYAYGFRNAGRAVAELSDAERLGFKPGPREFEEQADAYLYRAEQELRQAEQSETSRFELAKHLSLSRGDLDRAGNLYEPIAGFSSASSSLNRVYRDRARLQVLQGKLDKPAKPRKPPRRIRPWR